MKRLMIPLVGVLLLAGMGAWWLLSSIDAPAPTTTVETAPPPAEQPAAEEQHPLSSPPSAEVLPEVDASDALVSGAAIGALGALGAELRDLLNGERLVRKLVVTIDNLPRSKLAIEQRSLRATAGTFLATGEDDAAVLDEANYARYDRAMSLARAADMNAVATVYRRFYPLLQRAYQDLGYPDGHFNDRLIAVIDHLLKTPEPQGPIALVRPKVFYQFADERLEALSAGQKLLIRMGPAHRKLLKQRLAELRRSIAAPDAGTVTPAT